MSQELTFSVPTLFGVEGLCAEELRRLEPGPGCGRRTGGCAAGPGPGPCPGEPEPAHRGAGAAGAGLGPRPRDFDALFEGAQALPWERFIPRDGAVPGEGPQPQLRRSTRCPPASPFVKKAVAARLGAKYGLNTLPETGALYQVQFSIMGDEVTS